MADFGTILNPNNTSLDLYCNSITTNQSPESNSYFKASFPPALVGQTDTLIVNFTPLLSTNFVAESPKIIAIRNGIYRISFCYRLQSVGGNDTNYITITYSVFNSLDELIYTPICPTLGLLNSTNPITLLFDEIVELSVGDYIQLYLNNASPLSSFGINLTTGSVDIN